MGHFMSQLKEKKIIKRKSKTRMHDVILSQLKMLYLMPPMRNRHICSNMCNNSDIAFREMLNKKNKKYKEGYRLILCLCLKMLYDRRL